MLSWFKQLDLLLRGEKTRPAVLLKEGFNVRVNGLLLVIILLCMGYGLCMGSYSLLKEVTAEVSDQHPAYMQMVATVIKVPALFLLTLLITLPSLYVLNALVGSQLSAVGLVRLLLASLAINTAVLASMGPIVLFFSLSTKSYPFILLLNVAAYTVAGIFGLLFLLQTLHRLTVSETTQDIAENRAQSAEGAEDSATSPNKEGDEDSGPKKEDHPLEMPEGQMLAKHTRFVFRCWVVLFALVGAQMGWVLRPFVGNPALPFTWFRERESNFFSGVFKALINLLGGG